MPIGHFLRQALAPAATAALLMGVHAQHVASTDPQAVEAYHADARAAIEHVPTRIGNWVGSDVDVPKAAVALLKPNALLGRRYVNRETGRTANLVIVQCRDTRDMGGHYPPVCYPAHGWSDTSRGEQVALHAGSRRIRASRYVFSRTEFDRVTRIAIFNFFVLPGVGVVEDMEGVRRAAADYGRRQYGAAQVQIVLDAALPEAAQEQIGLEILEAIGPAIDALGAAGGNDAS